MRVLRTPDVEAKTGYCERQLRDLERKGEFPQRFQLSPTGRAVGWLESEVDEWIVTRVSTRRPAIQGDDDMGQG